MKRFCVGICFAVLYLSPVIGRGDVFVLSSGGQVEGTLMNLDEASRQTYVVKTTSGATVTLSRTQVKQVMSRNEAQRRYEELLPKMPNSAEGHWKMAEWCLKVGLDSPREYHLREILKVEPDHEGARRGLGYQKRNGGWFTTEEILSLQGYVRQQGVWRLQQDIDLRQMRDQVRNDEIHWKNEVKRLRRKLNERNPERAIAELKAIRHPAAAPALADLLADKGEPLELRRIYLDLLGRMDSGAALTALCNRALYDEDDNIRDKSLDYLVEKNSRQVVQFFISKLDEKDNLTINRAGLALARFKEPDASLPLFDALVTSHKQQVSAGGGISPTFSGNGGGGLSAGGGPQFINHQLQNSGVLSALTATHPGVNFSFDKAAWRRWYAEVNTPKSSQLRRDP